MIVFHGLGGVDVNASRAKCLGQGESCILAASLAAVLCCLILASIHDFIQSEGHAHVVITGIVQVACPEIDWLRTRNGFYCVSD